MTTEQLAASLNVPINDKTQQLLENLNVQLTQTSSNDSSKSSDTKKSSECSASPAGPTANASNSGYNKERRSSYRGQSGYSHLPSDSGAPSSPSHHQNHYNNNYNNTSRQSHHGANPIPPPMIDRGGNQRSRGGGMGQGQYRGGSFSKSKHSGGPNAWN